MKEAMGDRVIVEGLAIEARAGVSDGERSQPVWLSVDVVAELDLRPAAASDDLADTVDYRSICATAVEVCAAREYRLLEAVAGAIADALIARHAGCRFEVAVFKPRRGLPGRPERVGVRVVRPERVEGAERPARSSTAARTR